MPCRSARYSLRALAMVAEHDGTARPVTLVKHNGRHIIGVSPAHCDDVTNEDTVSPDADHGLPRHDRLHLLATSGRFSATEIRTWYLLAVEQLTVAQVASIERCTQQAIVARLVGNSKRQGGVIKKGPANLDPLPAIGFGDVKTSQRSNTPAK